MSEPFIGEIRLFPYARGAPSGWNICDGSLQSIADNPALYNLLGTTYGGDGQTTFGLPDMRGRVPIHQGNGTGLSPYALGQIGGTETVTLTSEQMPSHFHYPSASTQAGGSAAPTNNVTATNPDQTFYPVAGDGSSPYALPPATIGASGNNQAHENVGPTLALNYCIALLGIYPSQN